MPHVLICTNHLRELKGSELVTLELAEYFLTQDWWVSIYTNLFLPPVADEFTKLPHQDRLRIARDPYEDFNATYDLIWIQHSLLPPGVIERLSQGWVTTPIVWHHLSSFVHIEMPLLATIENKLTDVPSTMSLEAQQELVRFGLDKKQLLLFDNPAPDRFADAPLKEESSKLAKLLVVSHHAPPEVTDAVIQLAEDGITVDTLGGTARAARVTPQTLSQYDAVLTIGKTVQYSLSLGVPCYVYDHFGGVGWLTKDNLQTEAYYNFSGRASKRTAVGSVIASELKQGFTAAQTYARQNRETFAERWRLSSHMTRLLQDKRIKKPKRKKLSTAETLQFAAFAELHRGLYRTLEYYKDQAKTGN